MLNLRKQIRFFFNLLLLIHLLTVSVSIEFLHNHHFAEKCNAGHNKYGTQHKSHISNSDACWVCTAHLLQEAVLDFQTCKLSAQQYIIAIPPFYENINNLPESASLFLRGPPIG